MLTASVGAAANPKGYSYLALNPSSTRPATNTNHPILLLALCNLMVALHGCACFNDTLAVDIGGQLDLLKLELAEGSSSRESWAPGNGFECDFDAEPWSRDDAHTT